MTGPYTDKEIKDMQRLCVDGTRLLPSETLQLLDELENAKMARDMEADEVTNLSMNVIPKLTAERDQARKELAEARAQLAKADALASEVECLEHHEECGTYTVSVCDCHLNATLASLRAYRASRNPAPPYGPGEGGAT